MTMQVTDEMKDVLAEETTSGNPVVAMTRRILLAGVGAVALAQEEVEAFVSRLVEKGEIAERDGRRLVNDIVDRRKSQVENVQDDIETRLEGQIEKVITRMNIPTKSDINELSQKIALLTEKVEDLKKASK